MRIISGDFRGKALAAVGKGDAAAHLRPTTDRVRESLFNVLMGGAYGNPISTARVLDVFAGTGALGLEALSRGAAQVTFVDDGRKAQSLIKENIGLCRAESSCKLIRRDARRLGRNPGAGFDLIFLDPPYGKGLGEKSLAGLQKGGWIGKEAVLILEEGQALTAPDGFILHDQRRYGDSYIHFLSLED